MRAAIAWLMNDARVRRMFLEPHLASSLDVSGPRLGFQGCRAARHDDHLHVEFHP